MENSAKCNKWKGDGIGKNGERSFLSISIQMAHIPKRWKTNRNVCRKNKRFKNIIQKFNPLMSVGDKNS